MLIDDAKWMSPMQLVTGIQNPTRRPYVIESMDGPDSEAFDRQFGDTLGDAIACFTSQCLCIDAGFVVLYRYEGDNHYRIQGTFYI